MTFLRAFALILWVLFVWAVVDMVNGNPTAINGVIGGGVCAVFVTVIAILDRP